MSSNNVGIALIVIVALAIAGLVFTHNKKTATTTTTQTTTTTETQTDAFSTTQQTSDTTNTTTPTTPMTTPQVTKAVFTTNLGAFTVELYGDKTPITVENFAKLVESGFYKDTKFHRVIKGFMIQGGDPLSRDDTKKSLWGTGGPGYQFQDEFVQGLSNVKGTLSMANAGAGTNGSQFFINTADNTFLDGKHTVFGKVTDGMDVVEKISNTKTGQNDQPVTAVVITSIEVL